MIYIFEGIDGVGKTTLVNEIYTPTEYEKIKLVAPYSKKEIVDFQNKLFNYCNENAKNLLLDRCYLISHPIYSKILNTPKFLSWYDSKLWLINLKDNVEIFYCYPMPERYSQVKRNIPESNILDHFDEILGTYEDYMDELEDLGLTVSWVDPFVLKKNKNWELF